MPLDPMEVDPENLKQTGIYRPMRPPTFQKYLRTWEDFLRDQGIRKGVVPNEDHYSEFLQKCKDGGAAPATIRSLYSHLGKASVVLYNTNLKVWPRIYEAIKGYGIDEDQKKARVFDVQDLIRYCEDECLESPYYLVRAAIATVAFFGGNRMGEVKGMKWGGKSINN